MVDATKVRIEHQVYTRRPPSTRTKQRAVTPLEKRFINSGLESLEDCEILELLFGLALPYREYKKQAKECIRQFGSLRGVIETSPERF